MRKYLVLCYLFVLAACGDKLETEDQISGQWCGQQSGNTYLAISFFSEDGKMYMQYGEYDYTNLSTASTDTYKSGEIRIENDTEVFLEARNTKIASVELKGSTLDFTEGSTTYSLSSCNEVREAQMKAHISPGASSNALAILFDERLWCSINSFNNSTYSYVEFFGANVSVGTYANGRKTPEYTGLNFDFVDGRLRLNGVNYSATYDLLDFFEDRNGHTDTVDFRIDMFNQDRWIVCP